MKILDKCRQVKDPESGRILLYRDELEAVLTAGDTISRRQAIDALLELYEYQRDIDPTEAADLVRQGVFLAEKKIEQLPSAQPEIIHCRDCKWWRDSDHTCGEHSLVSPMLANDFCSRAERRQDDTDRH